MGPPASRGAGGLRGSLFFVLEFHNGSEVDIERRVGVVKRPLPLF
jgi:hypothetical protein